MHVICADSELVNPGICNIGAVDLQLSPTPKPHYNYVLSLNITLPTPCNDTADVQSNKSEL